MYVDEGGDIYIFFNHYSVYYVPYLSPTYVIKLQIIDMEKAPPTRPLPSHSPLLLFPRLLSSFIVFKD